jgi:hypothetical protein
MPSREPLPRSASIGGASAQDRHAFRRTEISAVKQIDLSAGSIRAGRSKTAAGTGRTIPLNVARLEH